MTRMMRVRMPALLAVCVAVLASGCSETPDVDAGDPMGSAASLPTYVEIVGPDGHVVDFVFPDESGPPKFPVRLVRKDVNGNVLSERVLTVPPTLDESINTLTDEEFEDVVASLEAQAIAEPESEAAGAAALVRQIRVEREVRR